MKPEDIDKEEMERILARYQREQATLKGIKKMGEGVKNTVDKAGRFVVPALALLVSGCLGYAGFYAVAVLNLMLFIYLVKTFFDLKQAQEVLGMQREAWEQVLDHVRRLSSIKEDAPTPVQAPTPAPEAVAAVIPQILHKAKPEPVNEPYLPEVSTAGELNPDRRSAFRQFFQTQDEAQVKEEVPVVAPPPKMIIKRRSEMESSILDTMLKHDDLMAKQIKRD